LLLYILVWGVCFGHVVFSFFCFLRFFTLFFCVYGFGLFSLGLFGWELGFTLLIVWGMLFAFGFFRFSVF